MKDMNWDIVSSEYLMKRPWLTVRKDVVRLPDGRINPEFYVLEYPDWVNVVAITDDDRFVMIRQYRHGLRQTRFEISAGVVEQGETMEEAARRELLEETGYGGGTFEEIMTISANASTTSNLTHCFVATGVKPMGERHLDATEDIEVHVLSRDEVFGMLCRGEFAQATMVAPLWKYFYGKRCQSEG
ncbi:MAG: NUDIX hydrolase [Muribaculaceae bacterium]|nr:NUDIX hydrolase [Muribaculaceae bacterium]MCF0214002.1 NUDIX hydrolase [Muribaculaceae bacterium]